MENKFSPYEKYTPKTRFQKNWALVTIAICGVGIIVYFLFTDAFRGDKIDAGNAERFGDFIGGFLGTLFTLVGLLFVYKTFLQEKDKTGIEKFENKYFELLKLHRDNVSEIRLSDESGRKVFVLLVRELREIRRILIDSCNILERWFENEKLMSISYLTLFFGIGPNSSRQLVDALHGIQLDDKFINLFQENLSQEKLAVKEKRDFHFNPFEGHQSRLGHYFRHLYQTVCFVDEQDIDIDKYKYVKTIRAQLSTHEQALLFINSLTVLGAPWWKNRKHDKLILRYKMVKNVPISFFNKTEEIDICKFFPTDFFEQPPIIVMENNEVF